MNIGFLSKVDVNIDHFGSVLSPRPLMIMRSRDELLDFIADIDVLAVQNQGFHHKMIDAACLRKARRLRLIQHHGVASDTTDLAAAAAMGIPVAVIPGQNSRSVAEHAFFLLMALARRINTSFRLVREGRMGEVECIELAGKRLCIVGFGTIGKMLAGMATGFGMDVVAVRRNPVGGEALPAGVAAILPTAELDRALDGADFTILALPLNDETFHLIDARRFGVMKRGSLLINVSRGDHVDRAALETALGEERIAGFATDAFWTEPADPNDPLLADERVLLTPHTGGKSVEAIDRSARAVLANIERFERGEPLQGLVGPGA
jgi:D-3-phosphoglycerate dehydrogenase